ncbi:MAG: AsmA family protein [Rhodospirillales bacterium]
MDRLKISLEQGIQRATGRAFTIDGPIQVSLGLSPRLTASNIRLANLPGGSRPDMLTARELHAQVALLPLLEGEVIIEDVTLENPDILLENGSDGTPNWQFHAARAALYRDPDAPPAPRANTKQVQLHRIRLNGGHIAINAPNMPPVSADLTTAEIKAETGSSPLRGQISGQADQIPFDITINAGSFDRLQGGPVTALAGAWPLTVQLHAAGATLKVDGGVNHPDELRGYAFLVTGTRPTWRRSPPGCPKPLGLPWKDVNFTVRPDRRQQRNIPHLGLSLHAGGADLSAGIPGLVVKEAVFSAPGPGQQAELNVEGVFQGAPLRIAGSTTQPDTLAAMVPIPISFSAQAASPACPRTAHRAPGPVRQRLRPDGRCACPQPRGARSPWPAARCRKSTTSRSAPISATAASGCAACICANSPPIPRSATSAATSRSPGCRCPPSPARFRPSISISMQRAPATK